MVLIGKYKKIASDCFFEKLEIWKVEEIGSPYPLYREIRRAGKFPLKIPWKILAVGSPSCRRTWGTKRRVKQ